MTIAEVAAVESMKSASAMRNRFFVGLDTLDGGHHHFSML
jgi:hypothetical protein